MRATLLRITAVVLLATMVPAGVNAQACLVRFLTGEAAQLHTSAADAGHHSPSAARPASHLQGERDKVAHMSHLGTCLFAMSPFVVEPGAPGHADGDGHAWASSGAVRLASFIPPPPEHRPRLA